MIERVQKKMQKDEEENTLDTSRLRKVLSKNPDVSEYLMNLDGSFMKSSNETLEILISTSLSRLKRRRI